MAGNVGFFAAKCGVEAGTRCGENAQLLRRPAFRGGLVRTGGTRGRIVGPGKELRVFAMSDDVELCRAVMAASVNAEAREAVARVYAELQAEVDRRRPACVVSGRCCRFEEYGHRLYVTTLEVGAFVHGLTAAPPAGWDGTGCPFQVRKMCGVHGIRPFGCRMFFCDATAEQWQNEQYERFHAQLKRLHETLAVPYFYVEWRRALRALGLSGGRA